jgi:superfamily II DNA or RNA helicase
MSSILRPYQAQGEAEIFNAWKDGHKSIMYQLCTGGGKTVLFVDVIKKFLLAKKRVTLIAHREELITQAWNTLYKNEIYSGVIKADQKPNYSLPCQVASIQTCARREKLPPSDLIIFDETHHSQDDNSYGNLLIDHYPKARVLGVTATPYRLGGKGFTDIFDMLITGPSFKQLVSWGYLTPLRYFIASRPDLSGVKRIGGDYELEGAARAMGFAPIVESYLEHCKGMCGLVFAVNITHSRKIVDQYTAAGITAAHVDANTPPEQRRALFKALAERKLHVLVNVGIATEGTDIPNIDFVQLARPTKSLSLFLQMVGRVTRPLWEAIKNAQTDEERFNAVRESSKPFGLILDNAGLWEEHGLPDQEINWHRYFNGIPKKKKGTTPQEIIEILEFVAEDQDGKIVRSKTPSEIVGLKLIEVNKQAKERIVNITSLKEFDRLVNMFKQMPKVGNRAGFAAVSNYKDYCRKHSIEMSAEIWDYMEKRLCKEPEDIEAQALAYLDRTIEAINQQYQHDTEDRYSLIKQARELADQKILPIRKCRVPHAYLDKERKAYRDAIARAGTVYESLK